MSRLTLVRHGRPVIEPDRPASSWELAADAVAEVQVLAEPSGTWFSSPEPKAVATARALTAAPVTLVSGLREAEPHRRLVRRPRSVSRRRTGGVRVSRSCTGAWLGALASARRRVVACARDLLAGASGDTVLVGHGTAWTLSVAELTEAEPDLEAWTRMRMPTSQFSTSWPTGPRRWSPAGEPEGTTEHPGRTDPSPLSACRPRPGMR